MIKKFTVKQDVESINIATMERLSIEEYRKYLEDEGLFMVDHHDILRSSCAGYPIALSKEQLDIYISELQNIRSKLRPSE